MDLDIGHDIAVDQLGVARSVTIDGGTGTNHLRVFDSSVPVSFVGHSTQEQDVVELGAKGISAPVSVESAGKAVALRVLGIGLNSGVFLVTAGSVEGLTPQPITFDPLAIRDLDVVGPQAGSVYAVEGTPNSGAAPGRSTTHIETYGNSSVVVGKSGSAQAVRGNLAVTNTAGRFDLTVDDGSDKVGRQVTLDAGSIAGLAPGAIQFDPIRVRSLNVYAGAGGDTFTVLDTPTNRFDPQTVVNTGTGINVVSVLGTSGDLLLFGGGGIDFVTVGDAGLMNGVQGSVKVVNPGGITLLTLDDHSDPFGRDALLAKDSLTLTFNGNTYAAPISWANADVPYLHFLGGSGGNRVAVTGFVNRSLATHVDSGSGNDTVQVLGGFGGSFYLDGDGVQDSVTVGNGVLTTVNGTVYLSNSKGHTSVVADDSTSIFGRFYRLTASKLNLPYPGSLTLTGTNTTVLFKSGQIDSFTLNAGSGIDNLGVLSLDQHVHMRFDGGASKDTVLGLSGNHAWDITATNGGSIDGLFDFTNAENLIGQTGVDVFQFAPGGSIAGTITGGGGGDWLDYSAATQGVFVDMSVGKASLVNGGKAGGISQIRNVRGSNIGNALIGDDQGNIFVGGAGSDLLVGGSGRNVLIGGGGGDDIRGGSAGDLLIAGTTSYDADRAALAAIQTEWLSADPYLVRIGKLHKGVGPSGLYKLQVGVTVFQDPVRNFLTGGGGQDWFFVSGLDVILNKQAGEAVN